MSLMHVQGTPIKKMVKYAAGRGFTDIAVFNEDKKHVNGLLLIHLPAGPTAHFKLSSLKLSKDIKVGSWQEHIGSSDAHFALIESTASHQRVYVCFIRDLMDGSNSETGARDLPRACPTGAKDPGVMA